MKLVIGVLAACILAISGNSFSQESGKNKKLKKEEIIANKLTTKLLEIKGMHIGMPFEEFSALYPELAKVCRGNVCSQFGWSSETVKQLSGVPAQEPEASLKVIGDDCRAHEVKVTFSELKKISSINLEYDEYCFKNITDAFRRKYGQEFGSVNKKVTTGGGAELVDSTVFWKSKDDTLINSRFDTTIDKSMLSLNSTNDLVEKSKKSNSKSDAGI